MAIKRKKLTQKEINFNKKVKKQMHDKGILPPDKPRLNRRKFAQDVCKEWDETERVKDYEMRIVLSMMTRSGKYRNITSEDIGILKFLKSVLVLHNALEENGHMKLDEMFELLNPIWEL